MVVSSTGTAYALTVSGLSVVPISTGTTPPPPRIATSGGIVNSTDGTSKYAPGAFITINGTNLASSATANTLPAPTVLGGSCVVFDSTAIPLLQTSPTQISAQIPASVRPGEN